MAASSSGPGSDSHEAVSGTDSAPSDILPPILLVPITHVALLSDATDSAMKAIAKEVCPNHKNGFFRCPDCVPTKPSIFVRNVQAAVDQLASIATLMAGFPKPNTVESLTLVGHTAGDIFLLGSGGGGGVDNKLTAKSFALSPNNVAPSLKDVLFGHNGQLGLLANKCEILLLGCNSSVQLKDLARAMMKAAGQQHDLTILASRNHVTEADFEDNNWRDNFTGDLEEM